MPKRIPFALKVLSRLDKIDKASVESYIKDLACEQSLYQEILDEINEGLLLIDRDGKITYANRQASLWLGFHLKHDERKPIDQLIEDGTASGYIGTCVKNLTEKKVSDLTILHPRETHLRISCLPLSKSSESEALVVIENFSLERSHMLTEDQLARIEALVSLAAGIAHEIGNPLNSIAIHLGLLKKELSGIPEPKRGKLEKTLAILNAETSRLDKIIKNFLKATRKPPLRLKTEDLNQILEDALGFMMPELNEHHITLKLKKASTLVPFLLDRERIYQAVINLIKNAMEAMPDGGTLLASTGHQGQIASLSIKDTGKGIDEEDLPHIFEAYYTTKEEGSGLGLMTVYNVVREHGGKLEVASKPGKGSTFTLFFPIRQPKLQLPQIKTGKG